jgi:hypothetical protein
MLLHLHIMLLSHNTEQNASQFLYMTAMVTSVVNAVNVIRLVIKMEYLSRIMGAILFFGILFLVLEELLNYPFDRRG